jgi:CDP-glucose 4,6-dehydratase
MAFWLAQMGAEVTGFALPPDNENALFSVAELSSICHSEMGDLRDRSRVADVLARSRPQLVIHMAAQALVRRSVADPLQTFSTNVMGTANLLDALRGIEDVTILVVTSDKVYSNSNSGEAFCEDARLGGVDPYSASKAASEYVALSYAATYFTPKGVQLATARAGNVIGGGDMSEDRIIPDCVRALQTKELLRVRFPDAVRPWQHVLDCLNGYILYIERLGESHGAERVSRSLNFGPLSGERLTVSELVSLFFLAYGQSTDVVFERPETPVEMEALTLDSSRAEVQLGWKCVLSQHEAVAWTAAWYKKVGNVDISSHAVRELMARQISQFVEYALRDRTRLLEARTASRLL